MSHILSAPIAWGDINVTSEWNDPPPDWRTQVKAVSYVQSSYWLLLTPSSWELSFCVSFTTAEPIHRTINRHDRIMAAGLQITFGHFTGLSS